MEIEKVANMSPSLFLRYFLQYISIKILMTV